VSMLVVSAGAGGAKGVFVPAMGMNSSRLDSNF
jgi:hypothetical protein